MRSFLFTFLAIPALAVAADSAAGRCSGTPKPFAPGAGDWNGWGVESTNSRYQPEPGLAPADVPKLKVKWAFGFPGESRNQAQPVIVGGRVFVGTTGGTLYSLDAFTGCLYWTYTAGGGIKNAISIVRADAPRWVAYFGDAGGYAHAVDAETGAPIWKVKVDAHPAARVTGSPTYYQGRLYVPVASGEETLQAQPKYECCTFQGSLVSLDAKTGRTLWKTRTIPDPPKPYKKNAEGTQLYGPAGAGIWSAPTIDEKRKRIYVGTGNSYTGIDLPTSDAILAFDLDSGSLLWSCLRSSALHGARRPATTGSPAARARSIARKIRSTIWISETLLSCERSMAASRCWWLRKNPAGSTASIRKPAAKSFGRRVSV